MADEYHSPIRQLKKAKTKFADLQKAVERYRASKYYAEIEEFDLKSGCTLHKLKIVTFPSDDITDLVYEIIDCHRSALDQIAYVAAELSGLVAERDLRRVQFPVSIDPAQFDNHVSATCKGFHPVLETLFRAFKAHPGGNDLLVELNGIRRQAFHRLIVPVVTAGAVEVGLANLSGKPGYIPAPIWDRKKHEITYRSVGANGTFGYNAGVNLQICFGEVDSVAGKPVVEWLFATNAEVLKVFEATVICTNGLGLTNIK